MGYAFKTPIPGSDFISYQNYCRILWKILAEIALKPQQFMCDDIELSENEDTYSYSHIIHAITSPQAKIQQASEQMVQMALLEWQYPELSAYKRTRTDNFENQLQALEVAEYTEANQKKIKKMKAALAIVYDSELFALPARKALQTFGEELGPYIVSLVSMKDTLDATTTDMTVKDELQCNIDSLSLLKGSIDKATEEDVEYQYPRCLSQRESTKNALVEPNATPKFTSAGSHLLFCCQEFNRVQMNLKALPLPAEPKKILQKNTMNFINKMIETIKSLFGFKTDNKTTKKTTKENVLLKDFVDYTKEINASLIKPTIEEEPKSISSHFRGRM